MLRHTFLVTALVLAVFIARPLAQETPSPAATSSALATVTITQPVLANGKPLAPGTYDIRLTGESLTPLPGQSADAERWVELLSHGTVVAREVAVVSSPDETAVGTSGAPGGRNAVRVEMLKGGEFLRVSVTHDGASYRIHLPVAAR